jgi:nucleoside diphosphate kinase
VAARMFAPSRKLIEEYAEAVMTSGGKEEKNIKIIKEIRNYLFTNYLRREESDFPPRVMLLFFEGDNVIEELKRVVGHITKISIGETIRGTYGDYIERNEKITYFEPAVLIGSDEEGIEQELKIWAKYSKTDGGILEKIINYPPEVKLEKTLVLIKPDSFQELSSKVGNIIDRFSQTGLFIIGAKVIHMGVRGAEEFYAPIKERLAEKMKGKLIKEIGSSLEQSLDFRPPEGIEEKIAEELKIYKAEYEFNKIIKFMTGIEPTNIPEEGKEREGKEKCLALVYQGENAITKIRKVLGETNPKEAAPGTVRKDFGLDIIKNGAHASDSSLSAEREMKIIQIEKDDIPEIVEKHYGRI